VDRLEALEPSSWDREEESSPASPAGGSFSAEVFSPGTDFGDEGDASAEEEDPSSPGEGGDVFPFAALGGGETQTDIVEDFTLYEDILRFEGLIDGGDANILTDQLQARLGAEEGDPGKLSVDAVAEDGLSLSIGGHTVEVRFEEAGRLSEDQVLALQSDDIQSQIEVLKLLFITSG
jgi:hypothetical protein